MGLTQAVGMAEAVNDGLVDLRSALAYHLQVNHYPPLSADVVELCYQAVALWNAGEYDTVQKDLHGNDFPNPLTVAEVVENIREPLHLDAFLQPHEDDELTDDVSFELALAEHFTRELIRHVLVGKDAFETVADFLYTTLHLDSEADFVASVLADHGIVNSDKEFETTEALIEAAAVFPG